MPEDQIEAKLAAYVDGLLPPQDVADMERHLAANPGQRRVVEQMIQARHWVATLPRVKPPADFLEAIDPTLERSALFAEAPSSPRWTTLISPQVLALAATVALVLTVLAAMIWLVPDRDHAPPVAVNPGDTSGNIGESPNLPTTRQDDALVDGRAQPDVPELPSNGQTGGDQVTQPDPIVPEPPPMLRLPAGMGEPVILSANVPKIPEASGAVSQFLTANELPFGVQRLPVDSLPDEVRQRLELPDDNSVFVYVVEEISLQQVGALTGELTHEGDAHALTPAGFAADRAPAEAQPRTGEPEGLAPPSGDPAQAIYAEDLLSLHIRRLDEPPTTTPAGMPEIGREKAVEVPVSADGYADFAEIGLGRIDVLGKLPADLAAEIKASLARNFQIESEVAAALATQSAPQGGRTREAVQLIYLDREPLAPGDVVQIELPDGSWLHTAVDEQGMIDAGEWGQIKAVGESAVAVQARLREMMSRPDGAEAATTKAADAPIRVVNLSARRAEGVDGWAETKVACLIILHAPSAEGEVDPWAPLTEKPATRPATQPSTQSSQP